MIKIKEILAKETHSVRHPVLRLGKPAESCVFDGDDFTTTKHWGLFVNDLLVGVASVFEKPNPMLNSGIHYQLRGMAVLESYQHKGYGERLLKHVAQTVDPNATLWFNARLPAVPFYEKCGYTIIGGPFEVSDIGPHFVMFKMIE